MRSDNSLSPLALLAIGLRWLLGAAALLIVLWSLVHVTARGFRDDAEGRSQMLRVLYWGDPQERMIVAEQIARFEADFPDVKVVPIHADFANFDAKLKTMLAAGEPPDVFYLKAVSLADFASLGLVEAWDAQLADDPPAWIDDVYPVLLDTFRYDVEQQVPGRGALYGLPKDFTTLGMYVNVDLFEQAGVPVPTNGWTWDEYESAARAITALPDMGGRKVYGSNLTIWPDTLTPLIWGRGGDLFGRRADGSPDFTDVRLDEPAGQAAMEFVRRLREDGTSYNAFGLARDGGAEFISGRIGIIGPFGRWMVPQYRANVTDFEWDFVPLPTVEAGEVPVSPIISTAWAVSRDASDVDAARELAVYLAGPAGQETLAELGLAIPALKSIAEGPAFNSPAAPANDQAYLDPIAVSRPIELPRQAEFLQYYDEAQQSALQSMSATPSEAAADLERRWARELASPLRQNEYAAVPWPLLIAVGGTVAAVAILVGVIWSRRRRLGIIDRAAERAGYGFIAPWLIGFLILTLGPMLLSVVLSMSRWSAMGPLGSAQFVGLDNFTHLFSYDDTFGISLWVTFYYVILAIPLGQVAALGVALLMNNAVRGINLFRTIYFVPSVISGVALGTLWLALFNDDYGLINETLRAIGLGAPNWFGDDAAWAAIPGFVIMSLWSVGGAMVIYLAGLKNIPASLYEAATIDGASPWHRFVSVTLPMLSPLVFFNLVMGIIGSFQVFTQAFVMTGGGPDQQTMFYVLNLYYQAFQFHNMGYASAMAWVLFVILLTLTLLAFAGSRRLVHYEGLK